MPARYARVLLRQHRFELRAVVLVAVVAIFGIASASAATMTLDISRCLSVSSPDLECQSTLDRWSLLVGIGIALQYLSTLILAFLALTVGVQLIAKETEQRTASLAWTLAPSRSRWFVERALVVGVMITIVAIIVGSALDVLQAATDPLTPLDRSLKSYFVRGPMVPGLVVGAFGIGVASGAVTGRGLPGLIVGAGLAVTLLSGVLLAGRAVASDHLQVIDPADTGALVIDFMVLDNTDGRIKTFDEAYALLPQSDPGFDSRFPPVRAGVPGPSAPMFVGGQLATFVVISLCALVFAHTVVLGRRA